MMNMGYLYHKKSEKNKSNFFHFFFYGFLHGPIGNLEIKFIIHTTAEKSSYGSFSLI